MLFHHKHDFKHILIYITKIDSVEDKANVAAAVDKVSMTLAKSGGTIASVGVTMFGIPSTKTRKRSTVENNYLAENGVCFRNVASFFEFHPNLKYFTRCRDCLGEL